MAKNNSKSNTKDRIINSAKKLFAEQGYQKTTVMDISKQAGLSEAALYEYFQGKEDLLLTIPDLWVSELIEDLKEQLFGIKGAFNKLRKYLWWYLHRIEEAPLDGGGVRVQTHEPAQGIDLADHVTLAQSTDGRIATHLPNCVEVLGQDGNIGTETGGG